MKTLIEVYTTA